MIIKIDNEDTVKESLVLLMIMKNILKSKDRNISNFKVYDAKLLLLLEKVVTNISDLS